jgi:hypothetical protein
VNQDKNLKLEQLKTGNLLYFAFPNITFFKMNDYNLPGTKQGRIRDRAEESMEEV